MPACAKMRILMGIHSLVMGGAEKFFTNLAAALSERHEVVCYIPLHRLSDAAMSSRLGHLPVASLPWFTPLTYRVFYKLTLLVKQHAPGFDPESRMHTRRLRALHARHSFDVTNAHLMPAARQLCTAFMDQPLPITKSDHGDTAHFDTREDSAIFDRLNALICPAEANTTRAQSLPLRSDCRLVTIPYGYEVSQSYMTALLPFAGVTLGMIARGVEDKGWREAVAAARIVRQRLREPLRLVLVGAGPAIDSLQGELASENWVVFAGQQSDAESWIRGFDIALLPSCLREESLPVSIIEYLACGKPVIATAIGGIPSMIGEAGKLVPLSKNGRADINALADAITELMDAAARLRHAQHASSPFAAFSMDRCMHAYEQLFESLQARR